MEAFEIQASEEEFEAAFREIVEPRGARGATLTEIIEAARARDCEPLCPREAARAAVAGKGWVFQTTDGERYYLAPPRPPAAPVKVDGLTPMQRALERYGPAGPGASTKTARLFHMLQRPEGCTAREVAADLTAAGKLTKPGAISQMLQTLMVTFGLRITGDPDEVLSGGVSKRYRIVD